MKITIAQQRAYQFIQRFIKKHKHSPTAAEIAEGLGIKSRGAVHRYVKALVAANLLELETGRHRNIRLTKVDKLIPLQGLFFPDKITEIPSSETQDVSKLVVNENRYALRAADDFLETEGVLRGDILVFERRNKTENEDIVLARSETHGLLMRKIQHNKDGTVTLFPLLSRMLPKVCHLKELEIEGILVALVRSFV